MIASPTPTAPTIRLGLRENIAQFSLLVGVNALVGGMIGQERTVLPLLAEDEFGLTKFTAALTFIAAFGIVKAGTNFFAGTLSDRYGRKPVLVAGWLVGVPVPLLLMWAPTWSLDRVRQRAARRQPGADVVDDGDHEDRPRRTRAARAGHGPQRGGRVRRGGDHRPGDRLSSPSSTGCDRRRSSLGSRTQGSVLVSRQCSSARRAGMPASRPPRTSPPTTHSVDELTTGQIFTLTSFREKALSSCVTGWARQQPQRWSRLGTVPDLLRRRRTLGRRGSACSPRSIPPCGGFGQLVTGALSDRIGRKPLIAGGMLTQAAAIAMIAATTRILGMGRSAPRCSAPARRWSTPRCSPRSATSPTRLAGAIGRHLPALARRRLRGRRPARRHPRRRCVDRGRDLCRRRAHRRVRSRRARAHVRNPPAQGPPSPRLRDPSGGSRRRSAARPRRVWLRRSAAQQRASIHSWRQLCERGVLTSSCCPPVPSAPAAHS